MTFSIETISKVNEVIHKIFWIHEDVCKSEYEDRWKKIEFSVTYTLKEKLKNLEKSVNKPLERCWEVYKLLVYWVHQRKEFPVKALLMVLIDDVLVEPFFDISQK